ncbi:MAG: hypothetical protein V2A79_11510 [Planctomycetota bacterium]
MAKEAVSPIERHLEKGVLALTVLLFVGVVVKYVVSSPNTLLIDREAVGPKEVYDQVADEAKALRERVRSHKVEVSLPPKPELGERELVVAALPAPVPFGPRVPRLKTEETGNIELIAVLPPGAPQAVIGRSGMVLSPSLPVTTIPDKLDDYYGSWNVIAAQDEAYIRAVNWVTVAATFNVEAQKQRAVENKYPPGRAVPYLVGAELQRREKHWDGTYGEWQEVKTYAPRGLPEVPVLELEEGEDGKLSLSEELAKKRDRFAAAVKDVNYRLELMRPMPPRVAYGDWWLRDAVKVEGLDLLRLDDEVWYGEEPGSCPLWDRYPHPRKERRQAAATPQEMEKIIEEEIKKLESWLEQGCYEGLKNRIEELRRTDWKQFSEKQQALLEKLLEKASALLAKQQKEAVEQKKRGEREPVRELSPLQVLWVHDTLPDSVISGKTYQYRTRALLYNTFAGAAGELKDPKDAEVVLLPGEWSLSSDDVAISYDTEFWLAGKKDREQLAKVDIFKWHEGAWVKGVFEVKVGDPIGGKENVKLTDQKTTKWIDFSTGASVVDLDFQRLHRERKKDRKGTTTLDDPKPTLAMIYLDSTGELRERFLDADKRDERYKEMKE